MRRPWLTNAIACATIAGSLALFALAMPWSQPRASADHSWGHCDTVARHPTDASYACEWSNRWIRVCDREVDGRRVRAWVEWQFVPGRPRPTGWAPSRGCHTEGTAYGTGNIIRYRVCVEHEGCSGWRRPY